MRVCTTPRIINLLLIWLLMCLLASTSWSQDFKMDYEQAKLKFNSEDYRGAISAFRTLAEVSKGNPYIEYALFYYALSVERMGFASVAKKEFTRLKNTYPQWNQLDEVYFYLAKLYWEGGDYFVAMKTAKEVKDSALRQKLETVKQNQLIKIDDIETLKMLLEENTNDVEIQRALAKAIAKNDLQGLDSKLFHELLTKNNWDLQEFASPVLGNTIMREKYRVALLFPFKVKDLTPSPERKKNQPVLELYQGMKLAVDMLKKNGVNIELLAYDTERDEVETRKLLSKKELQSVDLIVGPFFTNEAKLVQAFSNSNQINLIANPISNNSDFLKDNPYSILYQPSHETIGIRSAEWVKNNLPKKNTVVYYGDTSKDSLLAHNYMNRARELGIKVIYSERVKKEKSASILNKLSTVFKNEAQRKIKSSTPIDRIGSILVATDEPIIYSKIVNSVESEGDSVVIIGNENWLGDTSVDYAKFEQTHTLFASPNYYDLANPAVSAFQDAYLKKHGLIPTDNAKKGYELMFIMGTAMARYGTNYLDSMLTQGPIEGALTKGYLLQPSRDNGLVPFVSFVSGELKESY